MATKLEQSLTRQKRTAAGVLVPLFEKYHQEFHSEHWDQDDTEWLHGLMDRVAKREESRAIETVFSPSGLGGCLRQVFLAKNYKELGIPRKVVKKIETHFYFENGSWLHLKIQLKLYKLHKMGEIELLGTEIPLESKHKDNKGTLDVCFRKDGYVYGMDFKGWNTRWFMALAKGDCPMSAQIQLANYIILANANSNLPNIDKGLILAENKSGPVQGYPAAIAEYEIPLELLKPLVRERLGRLRSHEEEGTIPKAECCSTTQKDFRECAFRSYCRKEVEAVERKSARRDSQGREAKVATPNRSNRARRNSKRRGLRSA